MRRAIATVCLSGTLEEKLDAAAAAGFDGVEIFEQDLLSSALPPADVRARCRDLGLRIELYQPIRDAEAVPPDRYREVLRRVDQKLGVAEQLGAPMVLLCSNVSADAVDDDDLAAGQLSQLAERAAARGMRVAYEALAWGTHVHGFQRSWEIVKIAAHDSLGVCLDSFHILSRGDDPAGIREIPAEKIFFVQLSDAPVVGMDVLAWSRHHRCFPGQGDFGLVPFMGHLLATGYSGPLSLEVFNDIFRQASPDRIAVDAMRSLITLEDAVDWNVPGGPAAATPGTRAGPRLPPVRTHGFAFAELSVDAACRPLMEHVLSGMGFGRTGRHLTKPVDLWEQRSAAILLNTGPAAAGRSLAGDVLVAAIAAETEDPLAAAMRAQQLGAPLLPRERGPAEADLGAVLAPDSTPLFFCRSDAEDGWRGDFRPVRSRTETDGTGLGAIDHVGLWQPFDYFDEATLFYRSLLDLVPTESSELAGLHGLIRSRAMANADSSTRIAINVSLLGGGGRENQHQGQQHVAFLTGDIFATVRTMRANGVPLLQIPGNYYDDLAGRTGLPPGLLGQMRSLGVLYDRQGASEFFHAFTPLLSARFFFEVVQRAGGYDGYGAVNAPIRMAAQRHP